MQGTVWKFRCALLKVSSSLWACIILSACIWQGFLRLQVSGLSESESERFFRLSKVKRFFWRMGGMLCHAHQLFILWFFLIKICRCYIYSWENGWSSILVLLEFLLHKMLKRNNEIQVLCFKDILIWMSCSPHQNNQMTHICWASFYYWFPASISP